MVPLLVSSSLLFYIAWRSPTLWSFRWHLASLPIPAGRGAGIHRHRQLFKLRYGAFMAFGVSFEVPVAIVLLCWRGLPRQKTYAKNARMCWLVHRCRDVADAAGCLLANAVGDPMYCLFEIGVFFSRFYVGKGQIGKRKTTLKQKAKKLKNKFTARQGGCHMEYRMFDIGVNLPVRNLRKTVMML